MDDSTSSFVDIGGLGEISRDRHGWWFTATVTWVTEDGVDTGREVVIVPAVPGDQRWTALIGALELRRVGDLYLL